MKTCHTLLKAPTDFWLEDIEIQPINLFRPELQLALVDYG